MKSPLIILLMLISSVHADCIVQEVKENSAKAFCINTSKTELLENSAGEKFKVINYDSLPNIELYIQNNSLRVGETLKNTKATEILRSTQMPPIQIPLESEQGILDKINPFKSESLRVYATGLQLSGTSMKAEFEDSTAKIESTTGEFNSLPLDLVIELDFGGSGLILAPDFQDKTGYIAAFASLDKIDIGGFFSVNNVSEDTKIYDSATTYSDLEEDSKTYEAGLLIRNKSIFEAGELHTNIKLGYVYLGSSATNHGTQKTADISFNAGQLTVDLSFYKKVSDEFYVGSGLYLGAGTGHIEYNNGSNVLADKVDITILQVNFLKVMMSY